MAAFTLPTYISNTIIEGSPDTVAGKQLHNGSLELYTDYAKRSRKELNFHAINGTDIPAIINANVAGVIGAGLNIQSRSADKNTNLEFEALLKEHATDSNFDTTGRYHRNEFLRQIVGYKLSQGGVILRHHYSASWDIPYRLEMVGIDMIDTSKAENGLRKNRWGKITHIYLYTDDEKYMSKAYSMRNMTYYMNGWMDISQYTAVSRLVSILPTLDDMLRYSTAEVKAAMEKAKGGVYWSTGLYGTILQALNDEFKAANVEPSEKIAEAKTLLEGLAARGVSANGATPIPADDKIHSVDNKADSVYETLTQQSQKAISAAVGGSQVSVYKDISVGNYSSIKAAMAFDEEQYKIDFDFLVNKVLNNYLERLYMVGVQTGRISVNRDEYFSDRKAFHLWDILRTSKRVLDEQKDSTATAKNLESGTTTLNRVYSEKGLDYVEEKLKQARADIEAELEIKAMYEAAGLEYVQPGVEPMEEEGNDDEEV